MSAERTQSKELVDNFKKYLTSRKELRGTVPEELTPLRHERMLVAFSVNRLKERFNLPSEMTEPKEVESVVRRLLYDMYVEYSSNTTDKSTLDTVTDFYLSALEESIAIANTMKNLYNSHNRLNKANAEITALEGRIKDLTTVIDENNTIIQNLNKTIDDLGVELQQGAVYKTYYENRKKVWKWLIYTVETIGSQIKYLVSSVFSFVTTSSKKPLYDALTHPFFFSFVIAIIEYHQFLQHLFQGWEMFPAVIIFNVITFTSYNQNNDVIYAKAKLLLKDKKSNDVNAVLDYTELVGIAKKEPKDYLAVGYASFAVLSTTLSILFHGYKPYKEIGFEGADALLTGKSTIADFMVLWESTAIYLYLTIATLSLVVHAVLIALSRVMALRKIYKKINDFEVYQ